MTRTCTVRRLEEVDPSRNRNAFYRGYFFDDWVVFQWGRRGSDGQFSLPRRFNAATGPLAIASKLNTKLAEGYDELTPVTFVIPDAEFRQMAGDQASARWLYGMYGMHATVPASPTPSAPSQGPVTPLPVPNNDDSLAEFVQRANDTIALAVTDPAAAMQHLAVLNHEWAEIQQQLSRARSYLDTLDALLLHAQV